MRIHQINGLPLEKATETFGPGPTSRMYHWPHMRSDRGARSESWQVLLGGEAEEDRVDPAVTSSTSALSDILLTHSPYLSTRHVFQFGRGLTVISWKEAVLGLPLRDRLPSLSLLTVSSQAHHRADQLCADIRDVNLKQHLAAIL